MNEEPFQVIEIEGAGKGPALLIIAGVHGDEYEGIAAIREIAAQLSKQIDRLCGRVSLIPIVNGPAFAIPARCGDDGLDLARSCPGRADGSATERIAHAISARIEAADLFIDLHSGGSTMQVWPLIGYGLVANQEVLASQRRMARAFGLPLVWGTSAELEGRTLSVARDAQVPAIYGEYRGGGSCDSKGVSAYIDGCLKVMAEFEMLPERPRPELLGDDHCVEDRRPQSGHMQVCHPCPIDGYFESAVELGAAIEAGAPLGKIHPGDGADPVDLVANNSGRIIVLRSCCSVKVDDALAVILDNPPSAAFPGK